MTDESKPKAPISRRQFLKTAGVAGLGLMYRKPSIETLSAQSALNQYAGNTNPGGGGTPNPGGGGGAYDWWQALWDWWRRRRGG